MNTETTTHSLLSDMIPERARSKKPLVEPENPPAEKKPVVLGSALLDLTERTYISVCSLLGKPCDPANPDQEVIQLIERAINREVEYLKQ